MPLAPTSQRRRFRIGVHTSRPVRPWTVKMEEVRDVRSEVEVVYRAQHERLWRALFSYTGDPHVAEDAEGEAFAQLLRRGAAVNDPIAWVWRAAFKIAGGLLQSRRRDVALAGERPSFDPELLEFLDALGSLSDQQRACVVLRHAGRLTAPEIAAVLETSAETVRTQLRRAHARLRDDLDAEGAP